MSLHFSLEVHGSKMTPRGVPTSIELQTKFTFCASNQIPIRKGFLFSPIQIFVEENRFRIIEKVWRCLWHLCGFSKVRNCCSESQRPQFFLWKKKKRTGDQMIDVRRKSFSSFFFGFGSSQFFEELSCSLKKFTKRIQ